MKYCNNCGTTLADDATFCTACGNAMGGAPAGGYAPAPVPGYAPAYSAPVDPFDHTAEFDPKDISENKVVCMLIYLNGFVGMLIALLLAGTSKYVGYHLRQALKFQVISLLIPLVLGVGAIINIIPFLGWIVYGLVALAATVMMGIMFVLKIICFFQICKGQAKEPAIIRNLNFMK